MIESFVAILSVFGAVVTPFAIVDQLVDTRSKHIISWHLFGYADYKNVNYRSIASDLLISLYFDKEGEGKFRWFFAYFVSLYILVISLTILSNLRFESGISAFGGLFDNTSMIFFGAIITLPLDFLSLKITKYLLFGVRLHILIELFRVFIDLIIKITVIISIFLLINYLFGLIIDIYTNITGVEIDDFVVYPLLFSFISSVTSPFLITSIHICCIFFGIMHQILLKLLKINQLISNKSRVHEYPFTFVGLYAGILSAVIIS